jgi:hypothetical protein
MHNQANIKPGRALNWIDLHRLKTINFLLI